MTRNSRVLDEIVPEGFIEIHPIDAANFNIADGDLIAVSTRRGSIRIRARVIGRSNPGVVFIPFHFYESCANRLTIACFDPVCKIPELKVCACQVQKVAEP
jgi:predicted molibdopterin-dependent oxidoreductase YjgC